MVDDSHYGYELQFFKHKLEACVMITNNILTRYSHNKKYVCCLVVAQNTYTNVSVYASDRCNFAATNLDGIDIIIFAFAHQANTLRHYTKHNVIKSKSHQAGHQIGCMYSIY